MNNSTCRVCNDTGKISHPITGESRGKEFDDARIAWANQHPINCPMCGENTTPLSVVLKAFE